MFAKKVSLGLFKRNEEVYAGAQRLLIAYSHLSARHWNTPEDSEGFSKAKYLENHFGLADRTIRPDQMRQTGKESQQLGAVIVDSRLHNAGLDLSSCTSLLSKNLVQKLILIILFICTCSADHMLCCISPNTWFNTVCQQVGQYWPKTALSRAVQK